ncbi:MAG TPA: hypothetical protein VKF81_05250 [Blastocatellia bacterium]|nr:hypothetical protein [Blastocatellia bacterium]
MVISFSEIISVLGAHEFRLSTASGAERDVYRARYRARYSAFPRSQPYYDLRIRATRLACYSCRSVGIISDVTLGMETGAEQLIEEFLSESRASGNYSRERITRLAELATSENPEVAELASRAFFTLLVERLADSFEPKAVTLYNRVFAQLIQSCRKDRRAHSIDRELARAGTLNEEDVITRADTLRRVIAPIEFSHKLRRIIVLSRVTLGADVAITSVIIERFKREFPDAEILLLGGRKSGELFGADQRVHVKEIEYGRGGTVIARLLTWIDLIESVRELTRGFERSEYLIIDPDTRLTQLGLLPVAPETNDRGYLFFPSREYRGEAAHSLGELTSMWLDEVFGEGAVTYPRVSIDRKDIEAAKNLIIRLKRPVVALNFGVGENPLKRVGSNFEASLVSSLVQEGASIVLDKGAGQDESERIDTVIAEATRSAKSGRPVRVVQLDEQTSSEALNDRNEADILIWHGRVGILAALIGESDLYIGYDSAGQHIAAALGVPCIDVFAGFSSPRMLERWRPTGMGEIRLFPVEMSCNPVASRELASEVLRHVTEMLSRAQRGKS